MQEAQSSNSDAESTQQHAMGGSGQARERTAEAERQRATACRSRRRARAAGWTADARECTSSGPSRPRAPTPPLAAGGRSERERARTAGRLLRCRLCVCLASLVPLLFPPRVSSVPLLSAVSPSRCVALFAWRVRRIDLSCVLPLVPPCLVCRPVSLGCSRGPLRCAASSAEWRFAEARRDADTAVRRHTRTRSHAASPVLSSRGPSAREEKPTLPRRQRKRRDEATATLLLMPGKQRDTTGDAGTRTPPQDLARRQPRRAQGAHWRRRKTSKTHRGVSTQ